MKKYFFTGLIILLPLTVTIVIIAFVVDLLTKPFMGIASKYLSRTRISQWGVPFLSPEQIMKYGSQILILIGIFLVILLIGFIARWFFIKSIIAFGDKILRKIPLVNKVYKTTHDIIKTLFITEKKSFKQVVLVPFPNEYTLSIGLVSRKAPNACHKKNEELFSVFIPTTPNPTSGFLLSYQKKDLIFLEMKTEEAIKFVVSCGVVSPKIKELK